MARAIVPKAAAAFLDALSMGESDPLNTGSDEVYSVLYGGAHFAMAVGTRLQAGEQPYLMILGKDDPWPYPGLPLNIWPVTFPQWPGVWVPIGNGHFAPTHAAGRYQFEPATANARWSKLRLPDFGPVSQDLAAWDLALTVFQERTKTNLLAFLQDASSPLSMVADALQPTWTSLSPATFAERFAACGGG